MQAELLVESLKHHGIEHEYFVDEGMPHGYVQFELSKAACLAQRRIFDFLDRVLALGLKAFVRRIHERVECVTQTITRSVAIWRIGK